jgi:hypothetical protein
MEHRTKTVRGKNRFMAGRDPILPARMRAKSPSGLLGSRPATIHALRSLVRCFAAYEDSRSCSQLCRDCLSSTCVDWKGTSMPLLKPPEYLIATRKFFVRIEEQVHAASWLFRHADFDSRKRSRHRLLACPHSSRWFRAHSVAPGTNGRRILAQTSAGVRRLLTPCSGRIDLQQKTSRF